LVVSLVIGVALARAGSFAGVAGAAPVASTCTLYAAPSGNDANSGSSATPFKTFQRLADALTPGAVGCLRTGTYTPAGGTLDLTKGGTPAAPATLRAEANADVTFAGRLVLQSGAHDLVIAGMKLDGTQQIQSEASSVTVLANNVSFVGDDITAPTRICVAVGEASINQGSSPEVLGFVFEGNRVHHCGDGKFLGGGSRPGQEHGIYLQKSLGAIVRHNIFDHNFARGIQLYPDADETIVDNNVVDANETGINLGGDPDGVLGRSEGNRFRKNLITNSSYVAIDPNFERAAAPPAGDTLGNVFDANCLFGSDTFYSTTGFSYTNTNLFVDPQYNGQPTGDWRLKPTSPCIGKGVRPSITRKSETVITKSSVTADAFLNPHRMTATYFLRVRLCDDSDCNGVGPWTSSTEANAVGTVDVVVARTVSGLTPNRRHQYQWVARQALLPASDPAALELSSIGAFTTPK